MKTSDILIIAGLGLTVFFLRKAKSSEILPYSITPVSEDDPMSVIDNFKPIILNEAAKNDIEPAVIAAIIYTESRGNPEAQRYLQQGDYVFGLMQVRLSTAVLTLGFNGKTSQLIQPAVNIALGTMYLAKLRDRYGSVINAISAYNQGTPAKNDDGAYKNQGYVNAVTNLIGDYRKAFLSLFPNYFTQFVVESFPEYEV